eukprot:gene17232-18953_t
MQSSLTLTDHKRLWILVKKKPVQVLTCWCNCMAGTSQCCNHVIAALYNIDYALRQGYLDPLCTSVPCTWNKSTKRELEPKMIQDIVVRKKLRTADKEDSSNREEIRRSELKKFNPVLPGYQEKTNDDVSGLFRNLHKVTPESGLFLCISVEDPEEQNVANFMLQTMANKVIEDVKNNTPEKKI